MIYRLQVSAVFDSDTANDILNQVEAQKSDIFVPGYYTEVANVRDARKLEDDEAKEESDLVEYVNVDFDVAQATHTHDISGVAGFLFKLDVSFVVQQDFYDLINYIEARKLTANNNKIRYGRFFDCNHDSQAKPLPLDGAYTYIDYDGLVLVYPL